MTRWLRHTMLAVSFVAVGLFMGHAVVHAVPGTDRAETGHCVLCHAAAMSAIVPAPIVVPVATVDAPPVTASVAAPVRPVPSSDSRAPPIA